MLGRKQEGKNLTLELRELKGLEGSSEMNRNRRDLTRRFRPKQFLLPYEAVCLSPVSYTHLDVYKRQGYVYAHDTADKIAAMECLPESLRGRRYYVPGEAGSEARAKQRLEAVLRWRAEHAQGAKPQPQSEEQNRHGDGAEPGTQAQPQGEEQNRHGGGAPGAKQAAR